MTTKPSTTTHTRERWGKEWPRENGFYWSRDHEADMNILLVEVHGNRLTICGGNGRNVKEAFEATEFLGPITPSDTEQVIRLREGLEAILTEAEFVGDAKQPFSTWVAERCRAALQPKAETEGEHQL
jgi:hypothetical protein